MGLSLVFVRWAQIVSLDVLYGKGYLQRTPGGVRVADADRAGFGSAILE
jgi:hypothetical protein